MKLNNRLKYAIPMIITAILLCLIYVIKGIFPFGVKTIDYYDMAQQIAAFYYHTFDFLHGEKNVFFDPYTALSVNMAMSTSGCSHLSIFNLFFLFVKREAMLESLSIFLMLKMMIMSLFMYIYIHNRYKISYFYEVVFSVGYAFCGYVMMLYMTIQWLDVAALFPLLMLFLYKLIKDGKTKGYTLVLTLMIIASYYQSFMILIFIILMVGVVIFCDRLFYKQNNSKLFKNYNLFKLLCATVISLALSAFTVVPQIKQTLNSARFNNESAGGILSSYLGIVSTVKPAYTSRWWSLLGLSFAFAIIVYGLYIYRKEKKVVTITLLSAALILSELIVESINLFWHFGSYVGYPIRNGYMIYFTIACIACGILEKLGDEGTIQGKVLTNILVVASIAAITCVGFIYAKSEGLELRNVFHITSLVMAITFVVYLVILIKNRGYMPRISAVIIMAEIVLFGFIMIGKPAYTSANTEDPEQNGDYIYICNQLDKAFSLNAVDFSNDEENLIFSRVKNPDTMLNANYGLVLRRPVLSNWTHLLSPLLQRDASKLGYSVQYTRLLDAGGTVFADALLGVKEVISAIPLDEELYELKDKSEVVNKATGEKTEYYLYKCKYTLPYGVITNYIDYDFENGDTLDIYNSIYSSIVGRDDLIAESIDYNNIVINGKKALYYLSNQVDTDDYNTKIYVNGKEVLVPSINELDNALYPAHFNNNALYLGSFNDEKVELKLEISNTDRLGNEIESDIMPQVIAIDLDKFSELIKSYDDKVTKRAFDKSEYSFSVNLDEETSYLLLPISYDKGYKAIINGTKAEVVSVGGIFSAVLLNNGENEINLRFVPDGMGFGIVISLVGIILLVVYIYLDKKNVFDYEMKWLNTLYFYMFVLAIVFMYIVPYIFAALSIIHVI